MNWARLKYFPVMVLVVMSVAVLGCSSEAIQTKDFDPPAIAPSPYVIGDDDVLRVVVWKQEQLTGTVNVLSDKPLETPIAHLPHRKTP